MNTKYLKNLEFDKVVEMAAERAVCPETKDRLREEKPSTRREEVEFLLSQTDALAKHLITNGNPRISSSVGAPEAVHRAEKDGVLSMAELRMVAGALRNFSVLTNWFNAGEEQKTSVDDLFYSIVPQPYLEKAIPEAILSDTEMADTASDALYDLRRKIRQTESTIRDKLDSIVKNQNTSKYLQDAIISIRNGRFVIPVKAEHRTDVGGVIHDVSSSGNTLFVEPTPVVEANAKILQLRNQEQQEIERILRVFSEQVAEIAPFFHAGYDAVLEIDKRIAKAELALAMNAARPRVSDGMAFSLIKARHPLLDKDTAVPVDIILGDSYDTMVITGPNTGGKTVTLKTAGLLTVMAQTGYMIPVHDTSVVCVFDKVLVDIGDEQSIEQSLSTFSGHMKNITRILQEADAASLVLLDELGAGTDPAEGAALAVAIIEQLRETKALVMATTHYAELKMFALETAGVQNAGCEFDVETLRPTYRLLVGVPGKSNAFLISEKLGIPEQVIENARKHMSSEQRRFETVLNQLEELKLEMRAQEEEIEQLKFTASHQLEEAKEKRDALIKQGEDELALARQQAKKLADEVQDKAYNLIDEMKQLEKDKRVSNAKKAQRAREIARWESGNLGKRAAEGEIKPKNYFKPLKEVTVGQEVWLPDMEKYATVSALPDKNNQVEVRVGALRTKLPLAELSASPRQHHRSNQPRGTITAKRSAPVGERTSQTELNLRGKTVEEALMETDQFIDDAVMNGLSPVYLIHGKGTGALRSAIAGHLRGHKNVASYRLGRYGEGEDGVTVVELK